MRRFAKSLVQVVTGVASEDFDDWVAARSDERAHAPFFAGGFAEVVEAALKSEADGGPSGGRGLVLLWLHEAEGPATEHLCAQVWPTPAVVAQLRGRFVPWAGDVSRFEAGALARALRVAEFPALVAVQGLPHDAPGAVEWPRNCFFRVLWLHTGFVEADALAGMLAAEVERLDGERRQQAAWRQQLRQMQDMASSMARAIDDAREQARSQAAASEALRQAEEEERPCFAALYESRHGHEPPDLFKGPFEEALAAARSGRRLLLVWLFGEGTENDALCQEVLNGEVFGAFVAEYFVFWPGDAERWLLPKKLLELLRVESLPALLVLQPLSVFEAEVMPWGDPRAGAPVEFPANSAWSLQGCWLGPPDEEGLMAFLAEHGDRAAQKEKRREEERKHAGDRAAAARSLREQQDREYEEGLQRDREKREASAAEAHDKSAAQEEASRARRAKEEAEAKAREEREAACQALAARRRGLAEGLLAAGEPQPGHGGGSEICRLVLRLPDGRRSERRFAADALLESVYAWAECCGELSDLQGSGRFDVPRAFTLATTYPRAALVDRTRSLRELQLLPNAVLALCPDDE